MFLGTGLALTRGGAQAAFTPASLPLSLYLEQAFAGSPWTSTASAGTSGGRTATEATNPPTAGVVLGGKASAAFNGTNQLLTVAGGLTLGNLVAAGAGGIMILYRANAGQPAAGANATVDNDLIADAGAYLAIGVNSSGLSFILWDAGGGKVVNIATTHDGATWHAAFMRWDGVNMEGGVDHAATTSVAAAALASVAGAVKIGSNYNGTHFYPGQIREVVTWSTKPTDTDRTNIIAAWNAAYGLAL